MCENEGCIEGAEYLLVAKKRGQKNLEEKLCDEHRFERAGELRNQDWTVEVEHLDE